MKARLINRLLTVSFFTLIQTNLAHAFPEMVRYGYVNCTSCHVSLSGGGLLNEYGREIAREKLAMFKSKDEKSPESHFAYGALDGTTIDKYIKAGGDFRTVYYYSNTDTVKLARTIFMQGDLQAAYITKKFTINTAAGVYQPAFGKNVEFISRTHYAQYALADEWNIRGGKYFAAYGIKTADHVTLTRDPLHFGDNNESYNLELSYVTEQWNAFLTGNFGRFDDKKDLQDKGVVAQGSYSPTEHIKVGADFWYGSQTASSRVVTGPFGIIGLTERLSFQTEVDFQFLKPTASDNVNGLATTQRLSYELADGLWAFGTQEYGKFDSRFDNSKSEVYGIGVQFFPRSHFEFNLSYEKVRTGGSTQNFSDYAWLMSHFYL